MGGDSATLMACVMTDIISVACGRLEVITYGNLEKAAVRSETDVTLTVQCVTVRRLPMYAWFAVGGAPRCLCGVIPRYTFKIF